MRWKNFRVLLPQVITLIAIDKNYHRNIVSRRRGQRKFETRLTDKLRNTRFAAKLKNVKRGINRKVIAP